MNYGYDVMSVAKTHLLGLMLAGVAVLAGCVTLSRDKKLNLDAATEQQCYAVLRTAMRSDNFWLSIHAAEGLTLAGGSEEVRAYLTPKMSMEKDARKRCGLARELVRAGDAGQVKVLGDILAGSDSYGHSHAAESLYKVSEIGNPEAMRRAFEQTSNTNLQLMAAAALARHGDLGAVKLIRQQLQAQDPETFKIAAWILAGIGNAEDIELLRARLGDAPTALHRSFLEHAMAALGDPDGLIALGRNLDSPDPAIRTYAANFAGDARATFAAAKLKGMLNDPNLDARVRAAHSLLALSR